MRTHKKKTGKVHFKREKKKKKGIAHGTQKCIIPYNPSKIKWVTLFYQWGDGPQISLKKYWEDTHNRKNWEDKHRWLDTSAPCKLNIYILLFKITAWVIYWTNFQSCAM